MITTNIDSRYIMPGTKIVTRKGSVVTVDDTSHDHGNVTATIGGRSFQFRAGLQVTITV